MTLLLIIMILLSIYIIKSKNIKAAIKKDIEKIIPNNQHQHDKPQGEQQYHYNREISRKKPTYEPNQDKQNSQIDINTKDTTTEIKTIFLNIVDSLKNYYYKLKNSLKEYLKAISIENDVEDDIKHVEKPVYNVPQYNQEQYQNNDEPIKYTISWEAIEDGIMSVSTYILAAMIALFGSMIGNALLFYFIYKMIMNSQSPDEVVYNTFMYGKGYEYAINETFKQVINFIYGMGIVVGIAVLILSGYSYIKNKDYEQEKRFWILIIVVFNIFLGTFIYNNILYGEIGI